MKLPIVLFIALISTFCNVTGRGDKFFALFKTSEKDIDSLRVFMQGGTFSSIHKKTCTYIEVDNPAYSFTVSQKDIEKYGGFILTADREPLLNNGKSSFYSHTMRVIVGPYSAVTAYNSMGNSFSLFGDEECPRFLFGYQSSIAGDVRFTISDPKDRSIVSE